MFLVRANFLLVTSYQLLVTSHQLLVTSYQSLVTSHLFLVTSHQLLVTSHQLLVTSHQSLVISHYLLVTSYQLLITSHWSLVTSHRLVVTGQYYSLLQIICKIKPFFQNTCFLMPLIHLFLNNFYDEFLISRTFISLNTTYRPGAALVLHNIALRNFTKFRAKLPLF